MHQPKEQTNQKILQLEKTKERKFFQNKEQKKNRQSDHKETFEDFVKRRNKTLMWLCKNYPLCFSIKEPVPLKIGIRNDIYKILPRAISHTILIKTLKRYTHTVRYLNALISNSYRYNLDGEKVGGVTDKERTAARAIIDSFEISKE